MGLGESRESGDVFRHRGFSIAANAGIFVEGIPWYPHTSNRSFFLAIEFLYVRELVPDTIPWQSGRIYTFPISFGGNS